MELIWGEVDLGGEREKVGRGGGRKGNEITYCTDGRASGSGAMPIPELHPFCPRLA